ncbi:MAG: hypothetical protein K6U89_08755 [Chloroflexi bacterium]|nr:hypothetical protein [Chloroflexota bacterium]
MGQGWLLDGQGAHSFRAGGRHDLRAVAWRPASWEALVAGNQGALARVTATGTVHDLPSGLRDNLRGIAWRPDGVLALLVGNAGTLALYDGSVRAAAPPRPVNLRRGAWRPDGTSCLVVGNDGLTLLWQDGRTRSAGWGRSHLRDVAWRPDGALALIAGNGALYRFAPDLDDLELLSELPLGDFTGVAWAPGGDRALVVGYHQVGPALDDRASVAWLVGASGEQLQPALPPLAGAVAVAVAARPGSEEFWIVLQPVEPEGSSRVVRWSGNGLDVVFSSSSVRLTQLSFSPTGAHAIVVGSPRAAFWRS